MKMMRDGMSTKGDGEPSRDLGASDSRASIRTIGRSLDCCAVNQAAVMAFFTNIYPQEETAVSRATGIDSPEAQGFRASKHAWGPVGLQQPGPWD
jgi:hypothetical protein